MNCEKCKEFLVAYAEDLLAESQKQAIESHLKSCPPCRAELTQLIVLRDRLAANGKALAESDLENKVLNRILQEQSSKLRKVSKSNKQIQLWRTIMKSRITKLAAAAVVIIGVLVAVSHFAGSIDVASITFADVQKSIDSKTWVLIRYEDGAEEWANLRERRSFYTCPETDYQNFYVGMRDHINGIWRYYHTNWGEQIHEQTFTVRPYPQTPWEYAVGDWDNRGIGQYAHKTVEKSTDTIDGRRVVRFDTYNVGPLGIRSLAQQVWANPDTRLPVRIRKYRGPGPEDKLDTGDFLFPETGPSSIYDLGAPQGLSVVENWGVIEPAAKVIIDAAKQAQRHLPRKMRIVEKDKYGLSISYCYDNKFRRESYGLTDASHNSPLPIKAPETNEQMREWASDNLTLIDLCIFDGEYEYSYNSGEGLWDSPEGPGVSLSVRHHGADWIDVLVPIQDQWPYISNVGPMIVLEDEPGAPAGCVLLRYEGMNLRRDWYVDPERDYICVKRLEFRKNKETNQWVEDKYWRAECTDLARLQSGQWYARTTKKHETTTEEVDIKLLTDFEMELLTGEDDSTGFFDGQKLLKNALDNGAKVTFWAR